MVEGPLPPGARVVPCPACRSATLFHPSNRFRPFCSARCRGLDLGAWADESYRVASEAPEPSSDASVAEPNRPH